MTPTFIMMIGLPYSGKSSVAKELARLGCVIHSSDAIREELNGDASDQSNGIKVFQILHKRIKDDLRNGKSVVYDACNISYKRRMSFLRELDNSRVNCIKECIVMATPHSKCLKRTTMRDRVVPVEVVNRMYKSFYVPMKQEGWDEISFIRDEDGFEVLHLEQDYDQKNSHHKLTLIGHSRKVFYSIPEYSDKNLCLAAYFHDVGKPKTQTFIDSKGNVSEEAHYYGHQNVGAYDFMCSRLFDYNKLEVCYLIQFHMLPYSWVNDKTKKKYIKIFGDEFFNKLMLLHEADKKSH